jgi:hypothetical protein
VECAFQSGAFQSNAFQVCIDVVIVDTNAGGGLKRKLPSYQWRDHNREEEEELKLSQLLAQELQKKIAENEALMQAAMAASGNIEPVVNKVAAINPMEPPKPEMDPAKKAELMRRLEKARQVKEAKKREEEERAKQRLRNLAKARRVKAKNRK